ncbi:SCO6745 family protein [Nonomuraea dietziae]|uniref:SCO6745 family protein n=1 Tax=Nonomuraea dietziae TaxID=65515 RepID=UPI0031D211A5
MVDPHVARRAWRRLEPVHGMIYFVPEASERYAALGLTGQMTGYFASRGAAFGEASAEVVIAAFFNFNPALVRRALPSAWEVTTPAKVLEARMEAARRRCAGAASTRRARSRRRSRWPGGRRRRRPSTCTAGRCSPRTPRCRGPASPLRDLFHAQTLLREFRGDGHVAVLTSEGLSPVEALAMHAAGGDVPEIFLRASRGWPEEAWAAAVASLRAKGLLAGAADGQAADAPPPGGGWTAAGLTEEGRRLRAHIEARTDELALPAYAALGEQGCARLAELAQPFGRAVVSAGLLAV